jgi:hypothetical protein
MSNIMAIVFEGAVAVTKSDTTADPAGPFAGLYTGAGGDIKVTTVRGQSVTLAGTAAGITIAIACTRVWSTGTTPTNVLGLQAGPYRGSS